MSDFREHAVQCLSPAGLHRMAYVEWGDPANDRVLICAHGLARVGRDFDALARALAAHYRVVCPDFAGRGRSDRLRDATHYQIPQYVADVVTLLARLDARTVHWVGTSMGGLIGMALSALPETPVSRLVMNDVGPVLKAAALQRIGEYLGADPRFPDFDTALAYIRAISAPFGLSSDAQWRRLAENSVVADGGGYRLHYDPAIAVPFRTQATGPDVDLWPVYDAIRCPTLVLRGETSDLLDRATLAAMAGRGPRAAVVEIAGVGHAPMFMDDAQIDVVRRFLLNP
ncbi:MAG: alpha/beta fold hydrolase [Burkholderiales bacterium]|nr:alpha/beta fold hydrolase [Burkholderiales bacterium]